MIENYLDSDEEWVRELPYMKMVREEAAAEGMALGLRNAILESVAKRFDPSISLYSRLKQTLDACDEPDKLKAILLDLFAVQDIQGTFAVVERHLGRVVDSAE